MLTIAPLEESLKDDIVCKPITLSITVKKDEKMTTFHLLKPVSRVQYAKIFKYKWKSAFQSVLYIYVTH